MARLELIVLLLAVHVVHHLAHRLLLLDGWLRRHALIGLLLWEELTSTSVLRLGRHALVKLLHGLETLARVERLEG